MAKITQIEKLARAYSQHCGDTVAAIKDVVSNAKDWTDAKCRKHFANVYEKEPQFWRYVAEYRKEIKKHVAMEAADIIKTWERIALADVGELVKVATVRQGCRYCDKRPDGGPDPHCQACGGQGVAYQTVLLTDTDKLSDDARLLFDGAKMTKHGIEIKMLSREKALDNLARANGMFIDKLQVLPPVALPPLPDDPQEASAIYSQWVKGAG